MMNICITIRDIWIGQQPRDKITMQLDSEAAIRNREKKATMQKNARILMRMLPCRWTVKVEVRPRDLKARSRRSTKA